MKYLIHNSSTCSSSCSTERLGRKLIPSGDKGKLTEKLVIPVLDADRADALPSPTGFVASKTARHKERPGHNLLGPALQHDGG